MFEYIIKRLLQSLLTLFIIATVVFLLLRLMPEEGYFGDEYDKLDEATREAILTDMGLRDPLPVQMVKFYNNTLHGNLGKSIVYRPKVPNSRIIASKAGYSIKFGLASIGISIFLGIPLGILMALFKGGIVDKLGNAYVVLINAVPAAVYYLFIQIYPSSWFKLPMLFDPSKLSSYILPAISMSLSGIAYYAMWMRRYIVDEMNHDYVKFARAKGVSRVKIMNSHVLRNAFVPIAQYIPASILLTIAGSIYVESLFSIPGMGGLLIAAINRQDNTLVQALVLIFSSVGILGLLLGDLLMVVCDPRIKLTKKAGGR